MIRQDLSTSYQEVRTGRARRADGALRPPRRWMVGTPWRAGSAAGGAAAWSRHAGNAGTLESGRGESAWSSAAPRRPRDPCSPLSIAGASGFPLQSRAGSGLLLLQRRGAGPALLCTPWVSPAAPHPWPSATSVQVCWRPRRHRTPLDLVLPEQPKLLGRFPSQQLVSVVIATHGGSGHTGNSRSPNELAEC